MDKKDKKKTKHAPEAAAEQPAGGSEEDRKSTRLNSSHVD